VFGGFPRLKDRQGVHVGVTCGDRAGCKFPVHYCQPMFIS
jgi:hypothetical protein